MKFTLEQKAGMAKLYDWFDALASVDHSQYYKVKHKHHINAPFKDCANWLYNRLSQDDYDMTQREILNTFRLIYLKNQKVKSYEELILDTSEL